MSVLNLAATTGTALNITSEATVDTYTTAADGYLSGLLRLTSLNGAAATHTLKVQLLDSSSVKLGVPVAYSVAKDAAADTVIALCWGPIRVVSGQKVRVRIASTNSSDTAVAWSFFVDDTAYSNAAKLPTSAAPNTPGGLGVLDSNYNLPANLLGINGSDLTSVGKISAYWGAFGFDTATAGAASSITLSATTATTVDLYRGWRILTSSGTGANQLRTIVAYSASRVATVDSPWLTTPSATTVYLLMPPDYSNAADSSFARLMGGETVYGIAQGGAAGTITLASGENATNDWYKDAWVYITAGTGAHQQPRQVASYVGSTKVATMTANWTTTPDSTSVYFIVR